MANYFSSAPLDYGASSIERGWSSLGQGIAGGINQLSANRQREKDMKLRAEIEAKAREEAIRAGIMANRRAEAEGLGLDPMTATAEQINAAKRIKELEFRGAQRKQDYDFELGAKARQMGMNPDAKPAMGGPVNQYASPGVRSAMVVGNQKPLEQQIAEAEMAKRVEMAGAESAARAKAADPYGDNFVQGDNYAVNGQYVGRAVRDKRTGDYGIKGDDGKLAPVPEGATPITATAINKNIVSATDFKKFREDLTDSERSLRSLERYANSAGGFNQGIAGLADSVATMAKTLTDTGKLTPAELSRAVAKGQAQGLLGNIRTAVVGPGVLTEPDAARVLARLGGDVGALQNKEVLMQALSEIYQDKYAQYQDNFNFHNEAVDSYWGSKGFKRAPETTFSKMFGAPVENGNVPAPAAAPAISDFAAAAKAELARRKGK